MPTASSTVSVLDYKEYSALEETLLKCRRPVSEQGYEMWERYDSQICKVMRRHGKSTGWDQDVDFYHSGDWFHELHDGFALMTTTALSTQLLQDLQVVVAQHHPDAVLGFGGEMETEMCGLNVLVTSTAIYAAWTRQSAATCRRRIKKTGVQIL